MQPVYSINDYITPPIASKLSATQNQLRRTIMASIIEQQRPFPSKHSPYAEDIQALAQQNVLSLNAAAEVIGIYPISAIPTNKRLIFADGSTAYAMCALDALGAHYALERALVIESECQYCREPIRLQMDQGKVTVLAGGDDIQILHTDLNQHTDWSCSCCNIMHFFNGVNRCGRWQTDNVPPDNRTFMLDLETANKVAWLLFSY